MRPGAEFVIHPGAAHGYMMRSNPHHYHADAASKSWDRALQIIGALRETAPA
jgi:carboxymethylenebutenolidase